MNAKQSLLRLAAVAILGVLAVPLGVIAQQPIELQGQVPRAESGQPSGVTVTGTAAETFHPIRASKLVGMEVQNREGEKLGKVDDVVLDAQGHVRYVALSYGGFLGIGDKLFAVPWSAMTLKADQERVFTDHYLVVNVDKDVLKNAPGFDKDKWPDTASSSFWIAVDKHYGTERRAFRGETDRQSEALPPNNDG